jgi:endonuclease/exonuclease/phosphatase family metal-dependent hydrolase
MEVVVASYNMRKAIGADRRRRPESIINILREIDADIVALQEADRRFGARTSAIPPDMIVHHTPYKPVPYEVRPGSLGWHGNAILVRQSIEIRRRIPLDLPALEPRGAVLADLRIDDTDLRVVGMHLDLSGLWRRRQVRSILAHLDAQAVPLPTVLMGDLNQWTADNGCMRDFANGFHIAPTGPSFHARRPIARLDRIIVSPTIRVVDCGVHHSSLAMTASDHLPVWARLECAG